MKTVFIDTSAFYALFNRDDENHPKAAGFYREKDCLFITTHLVFAELMSLLTKRQGKSVAIRFGKEIRANKGRLQIIHLGESQKEKGWELFCKYKDKNFDLIDCLSFVCMKNQHVEEVFSFDKHFGQYGFRYCF